MDNDGLADLLRGILGDKPFQRKLSILSTDLLTGQVVIFDESLTNEERVESIISSTSIPFAFEPVEIDDMKLVDGSMYSNLSVGDPIQRCREEVENDSDIIIDIILCYGTPIELPQKRIVIEKKLEWYWGKQLVNGQNSMENRDRLLQ